MAKLTKKQKALDGKVEPMKLYAVDEAIGLVKSLATAKFDETVEVAMNLGRRPASRRPDGPRRRQPAQGHRQGRPRRRVRQGRQGRRGQEGRRRQWSVPKT